MNKRIKDFLQKDIVVKIISVLIAILIWFIVLDQDNPFEERTISVPLANNIEVLDSNNLQIVGTTLPLSVDVKIKGRRQRIQKVTQNDFKASIDLSEITESGLKTVKIPTPEYVGETDIIITGISPSSVRLRFEKVIGRQYPVSVEFYGSLPDGYQVVNVQVDPSNVILEEKEGVMARIKKVAATVNLEALRTTKELVMRATVYDTNDKPLSQFDGKFPVIINFDLAKIVSVEASVKGEPKRGWYFKDIILDTDKIAVIGSKEQLDALARIGSEQVDITGASASFTTELKLSLPKGITLLDKDTPVTARIIIEPLANRKITIPASMIAIYNSDITGAKTYSLSQDSVDIIVEGKPEIIENLRLSDIRVNISVSNLDVGEHEVPVNVILPSGVSLKERAGVKVIITGNTTTEPTPEPTPDTTPQAEE